MTSDDFKTGGGLDALSGLESPGPGEDYLVGRELGDYRVVRLIAEGGMGRVYLAERQDGSFERQVALKVAPGGALSRQLRARFLTEQGVLASLNHPGIAQLYDARVSDEGWPYFVMEYVDGGPITDYCTSRSLSLRDRIELLIGVVDAVAFAHARLIVHRDIKPSNVLVGADGCPKLLDFGIAKLLETGSPSVTRAMPMTPRYASPEQLLNQPITTAVDTYQLGLLTYEVLTGDSLNGDTTLPEAIDRARLKLPLSVTGPARNALPGEIVRIIEHCLRADADDRYRDAGALRDDMQAYLDGYPVKAVGQGSVYRLSKTVRRNWLPISMTALIILGTTAALVQSTLQRQRLEAAQATLKNVTEFQQDMLLGIDAHRMGTGLREDVQEKLLDGLASPEDSPLAARMTAALDGVNFTDIARQSIDRNILVEAVATISDSFEEDPVVASALRDVVSDVYKALGMYYQALPLREQIVADRERVLGPQHPDTLEALEALGSLLFDVGQYSDAADTFQRSYQARLATQGADHPDTIAVLGDYGNMLIDLNRSEEAERILRDALERSQRVYGEQHWSTGRVLTNLGYLYYVQGRFADVVPLWERALTIDRQTYGADDPDTLEAGNNLAAVYEEIGRLDDAEKLYRDSLAIEQRVQGNNHPSTLTTMNNLGNNLRAQRRFDEAEGLLREVADEHAKALGEDHPDSIKARSNYAATLVSLGRAGDAEAILEDLIDRARSTLPADHDITGVLLGRYGQSLYLQGRYEESEAAFVEGRRIMIDVVGITGRRKNDYLQHIADLYEDWGRPALKQAVIDAMDPDTI